ncbi:MAG TPA: protein phosphatase 2C domain-containing protein [Candidatus Acidoferrales bacterium]|nr:protein phosphatase 2C domain-containing protein [Candidatus Acidoferrales bacterium]
MLRTAGASDPGRVRTNNEDAFYADADRGIFLVVDGIGGHAAGEHAAAIAVERVRARLERQTGTAEQRVREAITMANNEILHAAESNPEWAGMACVLTLVVLENGSAIVGHVGDSRLYQIRGGEIHKITHDHSPVGEREDSRELSEAEAMRHPRRNEVYRDVGSEEHAPGDAGFIEIQRIPFEPDSALLLCSDGLSDQVTSNEIRAAVERHAGMPDAAVRDLIAAANRAGGKDNVTVLLMEGEDFVAKPGAARQRSPWSGRLLMFVAGALAALGGAWLARDSWRPAPVVIRPRTITVKDTIAAAMEEARPGDTVLVPAGEYREQVRLKSGVTLQARVPREPVIRAAPMSGGPAVIAEKVAGARLSGLRIVADAQTPLNIGIDLRDSQAEIDDVEVKGAGIGIEIHGGASPVIRASAIRDCGAEGVLIVGASQAWLSHNLIQANKGAGIAAREGGRPILLGNVIDRNSLDVPGDKDELRQQNFFLDAGRGRK